MCEMRKRGSHEDGEENEEGCEAFCGFRDHGGIRKRLLQVCDKSKVDMYLLKGQEATAKANLAGRQRAWE